MSLNLGWNCRGSRNGLKVLLLEGCPDQLCSLKSNIVDWSTGTQCPEQIKLPLFNPNKRTLHSEQPSNARTMKGSNFDVSISQTFILLCYLLE